MRYIQQLDEADCGAACLAMVASHYNLQKSITSIRQIACTDKKGTNLAGMVQAGQKLGFSVHALKGDKSALTSELPFPFIAHTAYKFNDNVLLHYVVVNKIKGDKIEVWNPDEDKKKQTFSIEEFCKEWTGYTIFLTPTNDFVPGKGEGNLFLKFLPILKPYIKVLALACVASMFLVLFGILSTLYTRYIIDEVIFAEAKFTLAAISIGMMVVVIFQAIIGAIRKIILTQFSFKINVNLVFSYFTHIFRLPLSFFDSRKTGEILSRLQDINKIQEMLSQAVVSVVIDTFMIVIVAPVLFFTNKTLFAIVVFSVPFSAVIMLVYSKLYKKQYREVMQNAAETESFLVETVGGAMTIKAMTAEQNAGTNYEKHEMRMIRSGWKAANLQIFQSLWTELIKQISTIALFGVGSYFIIKGEMSIGSLVSFSSLAGYFTNPLERLVNLQSELQESFVAADRLGEILELETEGVCNDNDYENKAMLLRPEHFSGKIEFKNVAFRYGTRKNVYENLSLSINPGEKVAFVGASGCGKTTLAKLVLKFYLPNDGAIFLDGNDIRDIDAQHLRKRIGYVPQEVNLFSGTIAENIALRNSNASLEDIVLASQKSGADKFINELPDRYNTMLGERGSMLSGGERQRLALARAILGQTDILILDEATSSLDTVSESHIKEVIYNLSSEKITTIIIAHRLSTVVDCDRIFVMDSGNIVQCGSHAELMSQGGLYNELWQGMTM